jgi:gliding motility-associated-like protein
LAYKPASISDFKIVSKHLLIIYIFLPLLIQAQHRTNNWYFGDGAGLRFTNGSVEVTSNGNLQAEGGCSTISDKSGNLLFYTNGLEIKNRLHETMPNGDSIHGRSFVNQNSLFIPHPADTNIYYLFTVDSSGFKYSGIDLRMESGLGDVIFKNRFLRGGISEKITAVSHCNGIYTWIITHGVLNNYFFCFLVSDTGNVTHKPVVNIVGSTLKADIGYLKASPAGNKIVAPVNGETALFEVFNFDNRTGEVSNPMKIDKVSQSYTYGVEFSADGKFLYVSTGGEDYELIQYDLTSTSSSDLEASAVHLAQGNIYALQLAPDEKIYVAQVNDQYLGMISSPEVKGSACNFQPDNIFLNGKVCRMGLPNFNQSYFFQPAISAKNTCLSDTTELSFDYGPYIDSVFWILKQNGNLVVTYDFPFLISKVFEEPGTHPIGLITFHCGMTDTIHSSVVINPIPDINLGNDTIIFRGNTLSLNAEPEMDYYHWSNGSSDQTILVNEAGIYWVETAKNSCIAIDTIMVEMKKPVVSFPTAFSPNKDGYNDTFFPWVSGNIFNYQFKIFNRFGQMIFYATDPSQEWDGTYRNHPCPIEVYTWEARYSIFEEIDKVYLISGNVRLIR